MPQLIANNGLTALRAAIADPERYVVEPKVDGVGGLKVKDPAWTEREAWRFDARSRIARHGS